MFACLYLPRRANSDPDAIRAESRGQRAEALRSLARDFSPRIEVHGDSTVTLDIGGLDRLLGDARAIGDQLRRNAADIGLPVHIAIASTTTAAILTAQSRAGLTVVLPGAEATTLAPLPLSALTLLDSGLQASGSRREARPQPSALSLEPFVDQLRRWGLRTLGDLAALPSGDLSARLGRDGLMWQRWARGEDARPLVPAGEDERFEESIELEWPIDGLEPLSFVFARLFDPLCERLEARDRGAVALHVALTLVTREVYERSVQLPAPMRDARVLRTLAVLDLESHLPPAAIDRVTVCVDVTDGRILQFGLFARALPAEKLATLVARLGALMGSDRVGAPELVDSYRPGAFAMAEFAPSATPQGPGSGLRAAGQTRPEVRSPKSEVHPPQVIRRFRLPIPARVSVQQGRPVRVTSDRRGFGGGKVERCEGPWRSSGEWWLSPAAGLPFSPRAPWDSDEWDVLLSDGVLYRISQTRHDSAWFISGLLD